MGWHEAYLVQARSEYAVLKKLGDLNVEYSHRLHYLQMLTEKLSKAMQTPPGKRAPAPMTHVMFVQMLQALINWPEMRRRLGYDRPSVFREYTRSLLDVARSIERLSPDIAGLTQPNPEYPWEDRGANRVWAPAEFDFQQFDPKAPRMAKIAKLVDDLIVAAY
ncbi:MAG: hypothetical protein ACE15C_02365 [Phycisphaerae bacterium]